jgi:hypothetical protein
MAGSFAAPLVGCFYCLSLWVSAPVAAVIGSGTLERVALWLALSAGAILLERVSAWASPAPAVYYEHRSEEDVLLRES